MFKRPTVNDTEEDILKQQEEFLKANRNKVSSEGDKKLTADEEQSPKLENNFEFIGNVIERKNENAVLSLLSIAEQSRVSSPEVFQLDLKSVHGVKKKKSLFAQKMEERVCRKEALKTPANLKSVPPQTSCQELQEVHDENVANMNRMSEQEIMAEKKSLEGMLSPDMLNFLKNRGAKQKLPNKTVEFESIESKVVNLDEIRSNLIKTVNEDWVEMDKIEPEKLEWIGDIPDAKALEPDQPYSARFDFSGDLQPFKVDVDVRSSLHHHGEEPERAGYTIQELYQLARSSVLQQRILALNTLACIIRKTKMGYYDQCFDGSLLPKLVETDLFFLLRFAMDDRAVTPAAVNCLNEFFSCRPDEVCLDRMLNVTEEEKEPILHVPFEIDNDSEEAELKDHLILAQDIVKGILRTDILVRFNYVLREFAPDSVVKSKIFEILIRICRHSQESCETVLNTNGLIPYVLKNLTTSEPLHSGVKLLRVIVATSFSFAKTLLASTSLSFILKYIDMDEPAFKLKLECLALWKAFLRHNLLIEEFKSFTPCLSRLLWFYVEKVDSTHGRFDFELFSAIVSLINVVQSKKIAIDNSYGLVLQKCLQKWIVQIQLNSSCNYSVSKALSCVFRFFTIKYAVFGVENYEVDFLKKLGAMLSSLLRSEIFQSLSNNLNKFSHLQRYTNVNRDPSTLPSLLAVYENGSGYVAFLNDASCLPLFVSMANFLLKLYGISQESMTLLELYCSSTDAYLRKTLCSSENNNWFSRYEVQLLASAIEVRTTCSAPNALQYSFRCLPFFRSDDYLLLKIMSGIFSSNIFPENLKHIYSNYFREGFNEKLLYDCKNVPYDWMYSPISKNTLQVLQFVSTIFQKFPEYLSSVPTTIRYYRLCLVFLDEDNVFNPDIQKLLEICFTDIVMHFESLDLNIRVSDNKSFYEFYTELITQYSASSYGNPLFAKFVTLPLAQKFDVSFRKLLWSEYMHALRVITLPRDLVGFVPLEKFSSPVETDESLLVVYLNSVSKNVLMPQRNGFIYALAVENVKKYLIWPDKDYRLSIFLNRKISEISDQKLKELFLSKIN